MSETVKTSVFAAVALVVALAAFGSVWLTQPVEAPAESDVGKQLFPDFKDPLQGASLEIVTVDSDLAKLSRFEVEQSSDGRWVIPSHGSYPADAQNRLRDAAVALIDLKILGVASDRAADHAMFGVIEPSTENANHEGVGTLIAMQDEDGKDLVRLIVGHKIKGQETQRFVRRPNQDRVYAVEINLDAFPSKFENWIEKDLLKLNPLDVKKLAIADYTAQAAVDLRQGILRAKDNRRMDVTVVDEDGKWKLESLTLYRNNQPQATGLLPDEELNETTLDALKNALDTLEIVDVRRKPQGLGADLKADRGFLKDEEGVQSLVQLGFIPDVGRDEQTIDLYAANGEVIATQSDGVEYVLKFGNVSGAEDEGDASSLNRYMLVTARVNQNMIPPPAIAELPPLPEAKDASTTDEASEDANEAPSETVSDEDAPADEAPKDEEPAKPQDDRAKIEAERDRITKENQRKQDEYQEKIKAAESKVRDLNFRFADWYYVVSEDMFKKIRVTRAEVIQDKEASEDEGFGVDAFRSLEEEGLKKEAAKE